MPNGKIEIEEFERLTDTDVKLNILYKTIVSYIEEINKRFELGNVRFRKLENRKLVDKVWAGAGGIVGGIIAALGMKWGMWGK